MSRDELMKKAAECDLGRVVGPLDTLLDDEWEALHRFVEFCGRDDLTRERNRSQMFAELVRGVAVVLHGPGYSDTSKLPAEVEALRADAGRYRWLRDKAPGEIAFDHTEGQRDGGHRFKLFVPFDGEPIHNDAHSAMKLDAAIDAAKVGGNG